MEILLKADGGPTGFSWYAHWHVSWQSAVKNCENLFYCDNNLLIIIDPSPDGKMFCFKGFWISFFFFSETAQFCFWIFLFLYCFQFLSLPPSYVLCAVYTHTSVFAFESTFLFRCWFFFSSNNVSVVLSNFHCICIFFCRWKGEMKSSRQTKVTVNNSAGKLTDHSVGTGKS